jgi:hypothetical protein
MTNNTDFSFFCDKEELILLPENNLDRTHSLYPNILRQPIEMLRGLVFWHNDQCINGVQLIFGKSLMSNHKSGSVAYFSETIGNSPISGRLHDSSKGSQDEHVQALNSSTVDRPYHFSKVFGVDLGQCEVKIFPQHKSLAGLTGHYDIQAHTIRSVDLNLKEVHQYLPFRSCIGFLQPSLPLPQYQHLIQSFFPEIYLKNKHLQKPMVPASLLQKQLANQRGKRVFSIKEVSKDPARTEAIQKEKMVIKELFLPHKAKVDKKAKNDQNVQNVINDDQRGHYDKYYEDQSNEETISNEEIISNEGTISHEGTISDDDHNLYSVSYSLYAEPSTTKPVNSGGNKEIGNQNENDKNYQDEAKKEQDDRNEHDQQLETANSAPTSQITILNAQIQQNQQNQQQPEKSEQLQKQPTLGPLIELHDRFKHELYQDIFLNPPPLIKFQNDNFIKLEVDYMPYLYSSPLGPTHIIIGINETLNEVQYLTLVFDNAPPQRFGALPQLFNKTYNNKQY